MIILRLNPSLDVWYGEITYEYEYEDEDVRTKFVATETKFRRKKRPIVIVKFRP